MVNYIDLCVDLGYQLKKTCWACPEQYDLFDKNQNMIAYFRLRHGCFTVECLDCDGEVVYYAEPKGDGLFEDDERDFYMTEGIKAVKNFIDQNGVKS